MRSTRVIPLLAFSAVFPEVEEGIIQHIWACRRGAFRSLGSAPNALHCGVRTNIPIHKGA